MHLIEKDDVPRYLVFLEDIFPYMEKFHYQKGMKEILRELKQLLKGGHHGTAADQALLLDYWKRKPLCRSKRSLQRMPTLSPISMQISEVFTV